MSKTPLPGKHTSLWLDTVRVPSYDPLIGDISVDVAVIGGGIVGVLAAHHMKEAGFSVALLEAREVLEGVTGNTTAKISASHSLIYHHLVSQFGEEAAKLYARANTNAISWVESVAEHKKIECDFIRRDLFLYAQTDEEKKQLEDEEIAARKSGLDVKMTAELPLPFPFKAGLCFANQAEFHPLKFLIPLLEEIEGDGSHIFAHTRATDVKEGKTCTVTTERGIVSAKYVIIASHFPMFDPGLYYARLLPFRDYAVAAYLNGPVPPDMYVGVGDQAYTLRTQPGEKGELLIVSGGSHKVGEGGDTRKYYDDLEKFTEKYFDVKEMAYSWSTQDNSTVDKVPYIGRISARAQSVFVATGFGGWGMAHGVVAAQLICDLITGKESPYESLYAPTRFKPVTSASELLKEGVSTVQHFIGDRLAKGASKSMEKLEKGEGKLLEVDGEKLAVYKDDSGEVHTLSPVCTHMGCIIAWNTAEKSWDCPCHGSRFTATGEVIHGPAVKSLERKEVK